jgi:hypothetical protein
MRKIIVIFIFCIIISSCQYDNKTPVDSILESTDISVNDSIGEETKSSLSNSLNAESSHLNLETTSTVESKNLGKMEQIPIHYESENISSLVNWYSANTLYSIIRDYDNRELNYLLIDVSDQNYEESILSTFAKDVPPDKLDILISEFRDTLEQIFISPDNNEYLILVFPPTNGDIAINYYDYELWRYDVKTNAFSLLIDQNSDLQTYCSMGVLSPSRVNIIENTDYAYSFCFHDFGQIIVNTKTGEFYRLFMDMGCYKGMGPIFAGNGEKVIVDDGIYWTRDYLDFIEQCGLQKNIEKKVNENSNLIEEFNSKKIIDIPIQLYQGASFYRMDYEAEYYYYHELGNGKYDNTNNGNLVRLNILTGEQDIVIPADVLNDNVDTLNFEIVVSPNGNRILLRSGNWPDYVYIYTIDGVKYGD